ncbi:DUF86 domain-containing protein [Candidatus Latescibacterota bacterium]
MAHIKSRNKNDIFSDTIFAKAVLYSLLIIGEAASGISDEFREKHKNIDWRRIVGMRNRLVHGYFDINLDIVWDTVNIHIPELIQHLENIIEEQ